MNAIAISKNTRFRRYALVAGAVLVTLPGVTANRSADRPAKAQQQPATPDNDSGPQKPRHHWYQIGRASWYGKLFQGQETASGENFDERHDLRAPQPADGFTSEGYESAEPQVGGSARE